MHNKRGRSPSDAAGIGSLRLDSVMLALSFLEVRL
jgi:hypothetical protein